MNTINLRRLIGVLLCMVIIVTSTALAFATDFNEPETGVPIEKYQYGGDAKAYLTISDAGTATFSAKVRGFSGVATKLSGICYLQKYTSGKWTNVKSHESSKNSLTLAISETKTKLESGTYRTHAVFKVYSGTKYETITVNSASVKYTK